jgi:hypothetical protein
MKMTYALKSMLFFILFLNVIKADDMISVEALYISKSRIYEYKTVTLKSNMDRNEIDFPGEDIVQFNTYGVEKESLDYYMFSFYNLEKRQPIARILVNEGFKEEVVKFFKEHKVEEHK